jgi:hypothetical protein
MVCEPQFVHLCINQNRKANIQCNKNKRYFKINHKEKNLCLYRQFKISQFVCLLNLPCYIFFVCLECTLFLFFFFCVRRCHSNGSWGDIRVRPLWSPTLLLRGDNTNKREKISLIWKWGWMQTKGPSWDLSPKRKENEADVYQQRCCCSETGLCVRDCYFMKTREQSWVHLVAVLHPPILCT